MRKLLILSILAIFSLGASAQVGDFFKPIPKPGLKAGYKVSAPVTSNEFRPIANVASYGIGSIGSIILTGAGISYQHLQFNEESQKWTAIWSINALAWYKAPLDPTQTNPNAFAYGLAGGFLNNLVLVGAAYDGKSAFVTVGVGISLNN